MNNCQIAPDAMLPGSQSPTLSEATGLPFVHPGQNQVSALRNFIHGSQLPRRWQRDRIFTIIELGLGAGLNLLATLQTWRQQAERGDQYASCLHYVAVDAHPVGKEAMQCVLLECGFDAQAVQTLLAHWPTPHRGVHRLLLADDFHLTLCFEPPAQAITGLSAAADMLWVNRPRPGRTQDEITLDRRQLKSLLPLATSGCVLVSDLPAAQVAAAMGPALQTPRPVAAEVSPPQVWQAVVEPYRRSIAPPRHRHHYPSRTVAIVGAGIAGLALAHQLHVAGWQVTILEAGAKALNGGSAQPALAGHVHFSRDDNHLARLTRNAQAHLARLPGAQRCPRWHAAGDEQQLRAQADMLEQLKLPDALLQLAGHEDAQALTGWPLSIGGLWQANSHILIPARLLEAVAPNVTMRFDTTVSSMCRESDGHWLLHDQHQQAVHRASVVVFCTARLPQWLPASIDLPSVAIAGQSLHLDGKAARSLRCVLGGDAYACPLGDGTVVTGSTWHDVDEPGAPGKPLPVSTADTQLNLRNWLALQRGASGPAHTADVPRLLGNHAGIRFATSDRLPLIGALPDRQQVAADPGPWVRDDRRALPVMPGVYMAAGFGSRGALWAGLAASLIGDMLDGAPLALEKPLVEAIAPQRFLRRRVRHNRVA